MSAAPSAERRSAAPPFTIDGVRFDCWVTESGQRYEWRSACGLAAVWRAGRAISARANGAGLGSHFVSLRQAMGAAAAALGKGRSAA